MITMINDKVCATMLLLHLRPGFWLVSTQHVKLIFSYKKYFKRIEFQGDSIPQYGMAYFQIPVDFIHEQESKTLQFDQQSTLKIEILQTRHSFQIVHRDLIFLDILDSFFRNTKFHRFLQI